MTIKNKPLLISMFIVSTLYLLIAPITFSANQKFSIARIITTKALITGTHNWNVIEDTEFTYPADKKITIYVSLYNNHSTYNIKTQWLAPNGTLYKTMSSKMNQDNNRITRFYTNFTINTEDIKKYPGEWKIHVLIDGELAKTCLFTLKSFE